MIATIVKTEMLWEGAFSAWLNGQADVSPELDEFFTILEDRGGFAEFDYDEIKVYLVPNEL